MNFQDIAIKGNKDDFQGLRFLMVARQEISGTNSLPEANL